MKFPKPAVFALAAALVSTASFAATPASLTKSARALAASTVATKDKGGRRLAVHVLSVHSGFTERQLNETHLGPAKLARVAMLARLTNTTLASAATSLDSGATFGQLVVQKGGNVNHGQITMTSSLRGMNENGLAADAGIPDTDGDGLNNAIDDDIDGDGIPNAEDDDIDGDGILNADDDDVDGDGIANADDDDVDGDDLANDDDTDIDGDGEDNALDDDDDGDGIADDQDADEDGDGTDDANDDGEAGDAQA
jgi:hypothetical protein